MKNVRDFGAHGNGVDDDTDAFRNALDACAPGETCFVPVGIYMIRPSGISGRTPAVVSGIKLHGETRYGSVLKLMGMPTDSMVLCNGEEWVVSDLAFDMGDYTIPSGQPGRVALDCRGSRWRVQNCAVMNIGRVGISAFAGRDWAIEDNYIQRNVPTAQPPTIAILVTLLQGVLPLNGRVTGNRCEGAGMTISGTGTVVNNNFVNRSGYGSGIFVAGPTQAGHVLISENMCTNGLSGYDDAQGGRWANVSGFEVWAPDSIISNNIAYDNDGGGIIVGGNRTLMVGNTAFNNGRAAERGGIVARYLDVDRHASYSTFIGNKSFDTRWPNPEQTQSWGFVKQTADIIGLIEAANDYARNKLGGVRP